MPVIRALPTILLALLLAACGGGGGGYTPPPTGTYSLTVYEDDGTTPLAGARVDVYDEDNAFVTTGTTGADGKAAFTLLVGSYTARVGAQGYAAVPPQGVGGTPFPIVAGQATSAALALDSITDPSAVGMIHGNADVGGALVVAEDAVQGIAFSGITDAGGNYVLFNVLPGDYTVTAFRAGFASDSVAETLVALEDAAVDLDVAAHAWSALSGQVTFLAAANGVVDITLVHPVTRDTIPGLATHNSGTAYTLANVPAGDYLAWATFANDGYVMDPDWVNKNGGFPDALAVTMTASPLSKDFSVTDAVPLVSPTNAADLVVPVTVTTLTPTFSWTAYPAAQQYVVEVRDLQGTLVWGGYTFDPGTERSTFNHTAIGTDTSAVFDFDNSAAGPLVDGETYRWRVTAFKWNTPIAGWVAISASEDQLGLFTVSLPPP